VCYLHQIFYNHKMVVDDVLRRGICCVFCLQKLKRNVEVGRWMKSVEFVFI